MPSFSQTISVPANYTEDNTPRNITLSYSAQTISVGTGTIAATLKSEGGPLKVKKLDINGGLGNDFLGWLLGRFSYSTNKSLFKFYSIKVL